MNDRSETKPLQEGYQPRKETAGREPVDIIKKGYQPQKSHQPEGQYPPTCGSSINPPRPRDNVKNSSTDADNRSKARGLHSRQ